MNNKKYERAKGIIGIALAVIMLASVFAIVPTAMAEPPEGGAPSSIRIYGDVQPDGNAPERYTNWTQPFDPTVIPKDSITFNPALLEEEFGVKNGENAREKIFLRAWYEPCGKYWGSRKNYTHPTINMEYTYMLINTQYKPTSGQPGNTHFAFPTCEISSQPGLGAWNCMSKSTEGELTRLANVSGSVVPYGKTVNGRIEIEKGFRNLGVGDEVQFLDHKLEVTAINGHDYVIRVWYAGNRDDDAGKGWITLKKGAKMYFDRHNNMYSTANHDPAAGQIRTWYVRRDSENSNIIYLGKELQPCDVFYVNGVRYDVTAIEVLDTTGDSNADALKYITLRTKLPKCIEAIPEESVVSSQSIECIEPSEIIPVLPPFNEKHYMVDDIDIPLWTRVSEERNWTKQDYAGTKLDTDNDGEWIAYDVDERIIPDVEPLNITYIAEDFERRYSTNLLEKLQEKWSGAVTSTERVDLFFLIDGSQSITQQDFELQKQGLAEAVKDPNVVPQDGTVRVCVIQFSSNASMEVPLTIIDPDNASLVADDIMNITQMKGNTNMSGAFRVAIENLPSDSSGIQVIDLSTDGYPTGGDSEENVRNARNDALSEGFDVVNTLGVGMDIDQDFLKELAYPQPWQESPGFYVHAEDYHDFMDKIREKIRVEVEGRLVESWTKLDIQSLPDLYTEFVLPELPDIKAAEDRDLYGDYLITTSLIAPQAEGDLPHKRVAFSYDPDPEHGGIDDDIYVNYKDEIKSGTIRVYGHGNASTIGIRNECNIEQYTNWEEPFNPTSIRKDSITFNAAILPYSTEYPMHAQGEDCDLKEYLRVWYVPEYEFYGNHEPVHREHAIVTETTYMLIDSQDKKPWHADANRSWFPFPIVADLSDGKAKGLQSFENEGVESTMDNLVMLSYVNCSPADLLNTLHKTTNGTIRLEKTYIMSANQKVEFMDHTLKFEGFDEVTDEPSVEIKYCGNKDEIMDPSPRYGISSTTRFYDRHNNDYDTPKHPDRTWYARYDGRLKGGKAMITVGKELQRGDIFYVDGVRYEIAAIEVFDEDGNLANGCEKFKYITIRTPFPKGEGELLQQWRSCADSQYIQRIAHSTPIPVLPPMNMVHKIVDDTDVALWQPLKLLDKWPYGDPNGIPGIEYFPCADRYLTMQYPPYAWLKYFRAVPIDTDGDMETEIPSDWQLWEDYGGPFYPGDVTNAVPDGWQCCECGIPMPLPTKFTIFDSEHWIANDVDERIVSNVAPLDFEWKEEEAEPRYSTNLLEILNETLFADSEAYESWTKYDIQTLPDEYTTFKLPETPSVNPNVYIGGEYQVYQPDTRKYPGSYLITTSFIAPNAKGDLNLEQSYSVPNRFAFSFNPADSTGIYVNENPLLPPPPGADRFTIQLKALQNYLSLPVLPENRDPEAIFGRDVEVWSYNATSGWSRPSELEAGKGYYVYNPWAPKTITIYGEGVRLEWSDIKPTLQPGWNLIGVGNESISVSWLDNVQIWRYMNGYPYGDFWPMPPNIRVQLQPGQAYWIYKIA